MAFKTAILALSSVALTPIAYTDKTTGEKAFIKRMTLSEREAYSNAVLNAPKGKSNAVGFSHIVVDQNGNRIFDDNDIDAIGNLPDNVVFDALEVFSKAAQPTSIEQAEKKLRAAYQTRFLFKLAGHLGMTVAQLKSSLDADELAHWMAYDQLDPIGGYRLDANFAQLAMCQVGDKDSKLSDFLLVDPDPISDDEAQRREREAIAESNRRSHEAMKAQIAKLLEKQSSKKALSNE